MRKLQSARGFTSSRAWMLKNDGTAVPVAIHVYGEVGSLESNAEAAIFLSKWAPSEEVTKFLNRFMAELLISNSRDALNLTGSDVDEEIRKILETLPYNIGTCLGMNKSQTADYLIRQRKKSYFDTGSEAFDFCDTFSPNDCGEDMMRDLNQQFIRVRVGGRYDSVPGVQSVYFRIGSCHFNWADVIYVFVSDHKHQFSDITIERDNESDAGDLGERSGYTLYRNRRGIPYQHMPVSEFLEEEKTPLLASKKFTKPGLIGAIESKLMSGASFTDCLRLQANRERVILTYGKIRRSEVDEIEQ